MIQIRTGKTIEPFRLMVYGTPGIGKTTFASLAPSPLIVQIEDGANRLDCAKTELIRRWEDLTMFLQWLPSSEDYKTVVIDSVDALVDLAKEYICHNKRVENVAEIPYGQGFKLLNETVASVIQMLQEIKDSGKNIIVIGHSQLEKVISPIDGEFNRYNVESDAKSSKNDFFKWCDICGFAHWKEVEIGNKRVRSRVIDFEESKYFVAKTRYNVKPHYVLGAEFYNDLKTDILNEGGTNG